jgi:ABC-type multidrug transport system permease subunit
MNEQSAKLLEQLANKLGTTSEYLWGVLIKQAPIDATVQLLQTLVLVIFGWLLWKAHKKLSAKPKDQNSYDSSYYDRYDTLAVIPMVIATLVWALLIIICFICFGSIISGYFNPEYWALKEILNAMSCGK